MVNSGRFTSKDHYTDTTDGSFSIPITTADACPAPTLTASSLPAGLTFTDNGNGSAVLTSPGPIGDGGVYQFTLVSDNGIAAPDDQTFTLTLDQTPMVTFPVPGPVDVADGQAMAPFYFSSTGYPAPTVKVTGLPTGLGVVDTPNGTAIEGTPSMKDAPGTDSVTFTAKNKAGTSSFDVFFDVSTE